MSSLASYFDLSQPISSVPARQSVPGKTAVLPQYAALALGIFAEPLIHNFIANGSFGLDGSGVWKQLAFGLLIALVIFPGVYRNAFDPERPLFVQLCTIFASGVGWQSLFQAVTAPVT